MVFSGIMDMLANWVKPLNDSLGVIAAVAVVGFGWRLGAEFASQFVRWLFTPSSKRVKKSPRQKQVKATR